MTGTRRHLPRWFRALLWAAAFVSTYVASFLTLLAILFVFGRPLSAVRYVRGVLGESDPLTIIIVALLLSALLGLGFSIWALVRTRRALWSLLLAAALAILTCVLLGIPQGLLDMMAIGAWAGRFAAL